MPLLTVFNNESGAAGKLKSTGHVNESYIMHYKIKHYTYYKKSMLENWNLYLKETDDENIRRPG